MLTRLVFGGLRWWNSGTESVIKPSVLQMKTHSINAMKQIIIIFISLFV